MVWKMLMTFFYFLKFFRSCFIAIYILKLVDRLIDRKAKNGHQNLFVQTLTMSKPEMTPPVIWYPYLEPESKMLNVRLPGKNHPNSTNRTNFYGQFIQI